MRQCWRIASLRQALGEPGIVYQELRARLSEHVSEPVGLLAHRKRHCNRANAQCGEHHHREDDAVSEQQRHSIARANANSLQARGTALHRLLEVAVAQTLVTIN